MSERFSHLRLNELVKRGVVAALGAATAAHPQLAAAGTGGQAITAGQAKWHVNTNITFDTTSSNWGFSEGELGTRGDAFDGALSWLVSTGTPTNANGYRSPGGVVSITPGAGGTTVTGTAQTMAGLNVSGQLYMLSSKAVARSILFLQNPTGAPITVNVQNATNLGSDSGTILQTTSSGDATLDTGDNWFVSSDSNTPPSDPVLTFAFSQNAASVRGVNNRAPGPGNGYFFETFTVTVPPGETRSLMMFVQMSADVAGASSDAPTFNSLASLQSAGYLQGLSTVQLSQIVNWNLKAVAPPAVTAVPTLSETSTLAAAALAALLGMTELRRRQRRKTNRMRRLASRAIEQTRVR